MALHLHLAASPMGGCMGCILTPLLRLRVDGHGPARPMSAPSAPGSSHVLHGRCAAVAREPGEMYTSWLPLVPAGMASADPSRPERGPVMIAAIPIWPATATADPGPPSSMKGITR